ncbi:hypothetical protein KVP10_08280 [Candidimonas humi]|uniref:SLH domain-containing protein n=1 Tax=Candidimonas humi TaxID=683355 RepID=A0ABV8NXU7_9BURK|nr:hypothetical protein [Candidimonas humi]MBV6304882.1 hypothetical protein [Candidimonas humi]
MNRITHVAILHNDKAHALPAPHRHHDIIRSMGGIHGPDTQGFLDDQGNFLTREEALQVALDAGQVKDPANIRAGRLFSEDLW